MPHEISIEESYDDFPHMTQAAAPRMCAVGEQGQRCLTRHEAQHNRTATEMARRLGTHRPGRAPGTGFVQSRPVRDVLERLGVLPDVAADLTRRQLIRYDEPHRRYHTGEHLEEVLAEVARLLPTVESADGHAVTLAAWFHDAVYDPGSPSGSDEEASAALAVTELGGVGVPRELVREVARLVLVTIGHEIGSGDGSADVLVDADLAILAAPLDRYRRYVADVRAEYAAVDEPSWRLGRGAVLERFLADPVLFRTGTDVADRRLRARANMAAELSTLRSTD